jgi:hypothetical protein
MDREWEKQAVKDRLPMPLALRHDPGQHGHGMLGLRGDHLPCRIAVEINTLGADDNGLQIDNAVRVDFQGHEERAPIQIRQGGLDVGDDSNF